jgi:FtsP/CotA-like multicopper oxidase with cupredoxin domain
MSFTRRQMLGGLAGLVVVGVGAGARVTGWARWPTTTPGHDYELIAAPLDVELVPGTRPRPGPSARRRRAPSCACVRAMAAGALHQPPAGGDHHSLARHPPAAGNGRRALRLATAGLPGEYFDYKFRVPDAGSYWYHPHVSSSEELGRPGRPLIVEEREPTGFKHERTLSLKNWHVDEQAPLPFSMPREAARGGTAGRLSTINGQANRSSNCPPGRWCACACSTWTTPDLSPQHQGQLEAQIYALDGNPVEPRPLDKEYWLGPGMRICLAINSRRG